MSNIKVDVRYETPKTDKFTALMEQYKAAKELADTTERELTPLIEVGGKAKYNAILEQLGILASQLREFSIMIDTKYKQLISAKYYNAHGSYVWFKIEYDPYMDTVTYHYDAYQLERNGSDFSAVNFALSNECLFGVKGLVTRWGNKYKDDDHRCGTYKLTEGYKDLYDKLEEDLHSHIKCKIDSINSKTRTLNNTLEGIRGGN